MHPIWDFIVDMADALIPLKVSISVSLGLRALIARKKPVTITEKLLFISAFIYVYKAWNSRPINLNLGVVFAIISDQIMSEFKKIVVIGAGPWARVLLRT